MARRGLAETLTGAVVLLVAAGFLAYAVGQSGRGSVSGYPLLARFDRIDGLAVGADVKLAGVKVGTVSRARINPDTFLAEVEFTVQHGIRLPKDSSAEITSDGLLGGKYLSLVPGGQDAVLKPGETVSITQSAVSLEHLLGKFIFSASEMKSAVGQGSSGGGDTNPSSPR